MAVFDPTKPEAGHATTQSVRDNFNALKDLSDGLRIDVDNVVSIGTSLQFSSISDLQNYVGTGILATMPAGRTAQLSGYYQSGDGGGGTFWWDDGSSATPNGGTVIQPAAGGVGRWRRIVEAPRNYDFLWFGARGDGITDDIDAIMATIDNAKADGVGVEFSCRDYAVSRRIVVNGSDIDPDTAITGGNTAVLSFRGQGRAPFLARFIAIGSAWPAGHAVVTARNIAGKSIGNFHVDVAGLADKAVDCAWIGTFDGSIGAAAPSCENTFTDMWAENALKIGYDFDQAADCKVSGIMYRGGRAAIGVSMRLPGGGIWADNIVIGSGRFRVSCQNGAFQNCGFFSGVEIADAALNHIHFDGTHVYPYTPRRTLAANPFTTTNGSSTVVVSMPGHGLKTGDFIELAGCAALTNGIAENDLETTAPEPRAITWLSDDTFSFVAGHWDHPPLPDPPVFVPALATSTGAAGGSTVSITGRGNTIYSSATSGDSPRSLEMTSCYFNTLGVKGQKHFAGRWMNGARFHGCRFGGNSGDTGTADVYFDTSGSNWTPSGALGSLPMFVFDNCGFSQGLPVEVASKVLVGVDGYYDGTNNTSQQFFQRPGAANFPSIAFDKPFRLGSLYLWNDASGHIRIKNTTAPVSATDGNILVERQSGTASPLGSVTPSHSGAIFTDGSNARVYIAYNTTNAHWFEPVRLRTGTATPVGFNTPTRVGEIFVDTTNDRVYVAKDLTNADWIELTAVAGAYQPIDTDLTAIAALTSAADQLPYATGAGTWAMTTMTAAARTVLDDTTIAAMLATLTITSATGGTTLGSGNTASGTNASAIGGNNTASGSGSFAFGSRATDRGTAGVRAFAAGQFSTTGDAQVQEAVFRATTAAATATRLTTDAGAASATNVLVLPNNSAYLVTAECVIRNATTGKNLTYTLAATLVERGANAAATAVAAGSPSFIAGPASSSPPTLAAIPTLTADTTNGGLNISFTPPAANTDTYRAVCYVRSVQVV